MKSGYPLTTQFEWTELAGVRVLVVDTEADDGKLVLLIEGFSTDMLPAAAGSRTDAHPRAGAHFSKARMPPRKNLALQCRDADIRFASY